MSSIKNDKNNVRTKLNVIQRINDNPKNYVNDLQDRFETKKNDLVNEFGSKIENGIKRKDNSNDIFSEVLNIAEILLTSNKDKLNTDKFNTTSKILNYSTIATQKTIDASKNIFLEQVKETFFASSNSVCGVNKLIKTNILYLSPKEFDFLNLLTINPLSTNGKILYETSNVTYKEKVNTNLYNTFNGTPYDFNVNGETLFTIKWIPNLQLFEITNLTQTLKTVEKFFDDYYSNVEIFNLSDVLKSSVGLTLRFEYKESSLFNKSINLFNRIVNKKFKSCGNSNDRTLIKNQTTLALFDENDDDVFDFNNLDDIDLDEEDRINRGVIKFVDCNNFELELSSEILEDFVVLTKTGTTTDIITDTIHKASHDANQQNKGSIVIDLYYLSLIKNLIINLPKAIVFNLLSPKMLLPIVIIYKLFKNNLNEAMEAKDIITKLSKLFNEIIKNVLWTFIREFWKLLKVELVKFISLLVKGILKNKFKRYYLIITSLIKLLTKLLDSNVNNCQSLYGNILKTIEIALNGKPSLNVPNIMLGFSDSLAGYSQDRALMNISEKLEASGISLSPIYGEDNDIILLVKSIIEGNSDELDQNSFIKVTNKKITIPTPVGPIIIPPGILNSTGKLM